MMHDGVLPIRTTQAPHRVALVLLTLAQLALLALPGSSAHADDRDLLRRGSAKPYVFILFDTSGSMHWSPKCTSAQLAAGDCDYLCPTGDCFVPRNGDDPSSKFYQAKAALYDVIEATDNVDFGLATYNQDELRVTSKHWLYKAREAGVDLDGTPFPATGSEEVFGAQWSCDTGGGDNNIGCRPQDPASLTDTWELERVRRLPKGGNGMNQTRQVYVQTGGTTYEVTYTPLSGNLGDSSITFQISVDKCRRYGHNYYCNDRVDTETVIFDRIDQFISWDLATKRTNGQLGYFAQSYASDSSASNTCAGWDGNDDTNNDKYNNVDLRFDTTNSSISPLLDRGDVIPLDWTSDNRSRILDRLAPNRKLGESTPDFSIARYLDDQPGGNGLLEPAVSGVKPLIANGSTPLGNSIRDFRTWYAGCAQGSCPHSTGWRDLAEANDPDWGCRKVYLLVITDGDDTCKGADACSGTASLFAQEDVKTYVVAFGVQNTSGNRLNCMAANGGSGDPIYPENKQQLVDALTDIFSEIQEEARSFASAAVPTVQASVEDKIYLSHFTPLNRSSLWDGHLDSFLKPLPLIQAGPEAGSPDRSQRCSSSLTSGCLAWDAGEQLLDQAAALDLTATPPDYGMGTGALERRVFYGSYDALNPVPKHRRLFVPPADPTDPSNPATFGADWIELMTGLGISPTSPGAISEAKEAIDNVLSIKTVQKVDPNAATPEYVTFVLGDIFHSNPVALGSPDNVTYFLQDAGNHTIQVNGEPVEVGGYQEFALRQRVRRKMVLVGSNDGQLHVFDAGRYHATLDDLTRDDPDYFSCFDDAGDRIDPVPVIADEQFDNGTGYELFSFVPRSSMNNLSKLPKSTKHRYSVDSSVAVGDANIGPEETVTRPGRPDYVSSWRTVAVGGLRRGGRGYYALDITQPDRIVEQSICTRDGVERSTAVDAPAGDGYVPSCLGDPASGDSPVSGCGPRTFPTILWELEDHWDEDLDGKPDLGDTWSIPALGRIRVCTGTNCDPTATDNDIEDRWVAIFGGGFDEDAAFSGAAAGRFLYMVDLSSGETIYKQELDGMVPSDPAVVDTDLDGYLDRIYIGTTAGSLYKVDLRKTPRLRDVQVSPGPSQPQVTVQRISTADGDDPEWRPFKIFDTGGRPIFFPPAAIYVADQSKFAVAFGTGDRDDLWSDDPQAGRFYTFLDNDLARGDARLPVTVNDLQQIGVDDLNLDSADNLLVPTSGVLTAGWYLELDAQERLITKPFALSGVLFFTSYQPTQGPTGTTTGGNGNGRNAGDPVCARTGTSRVFTVFATNANALASIDGTLTRARLVREFVTDPFATLSSTKNDPVSGTGGDDGGGLPGHADDLCRDQAGLTQQLKALFPSSCRFANYTLDIQTIRSDRGLVCIAPVPVCFEEQNWAKF